MGAWNWGLESCPVGLCFWVPRSPRLRPCCRAAPRLRPIGWRRTSICRGRTMRACCRPATRRRAGQDRLPVQRQGARLLELLAQDRGLRSDPRDRVPALGRQHHSAPVLQRHRAYFRRQPASAALLDRRGRRHHRRRPSGSSGAWSGSTAIGPTTRPARWRSPEGAAWIRRLISLCSLLFLSCSGRRDKGAHCTVSNRGFPWLSFHFALDFHYHPSTIDLRTIDPRA